MRYLIDTNIFIYLATDPELLCPDVAAIVQNPETVLCMSYESVRELIVAYRNGGVVSRKWKTISEMVEAIEKEYYISILLVKKEHYLTYAKLVIDIANDHRDPSDHIIIAHAITEHLPLISSDRKFFFYRKQGLDLIFNKK